jgi:hypothetical protein
MTNIYYSDKNPKSNFNGNWDDICIYCGRSHREHIREYPDANYKHRMPCREQKEAMRRDWHRTVTTANVLVLLGWVIVPFAIAILGFANVWLGIFLFLFSVAKIGWRVVKMYGKPEKWMPGYKAKQEEQLKMRHYFYHCERNPEGFQRLKAENFAKEYPDES